MEKIEIDGKFFGYHIMPDQNYVRAGIYYKIPDNWCEFSVSVRYFGNWWREANERDYTLARTWCEKHIELIKKANK